MRFLLVFLLLFVGNKRNFHSYGTRLSLPTMCSRSQRQIDSIWLISSRMRLSGGSEQDESDSKFESSSVESSAIIFSSVTEFQKSLNITIRFQEDGKFSLSTTSNQTIAQLRECVWPVLPKAVQLWCGSEFELSLNSRDVLARTSTLDEERILNNDRLFVLPEHVTRQPAIEKEQDQAVYISSHTALVHELSDFDQGLEMETRSKFSQDGSTNTGTARTARVKEVAYGIQERRDDLEDSDELGSDALPLPKEISITNHPDGLNASMLVLNLHDAAEDEDVTRPGGRSEHNQPAAWQSDPSASMPPVIFAGRASDGRMVCSDPTTAASLSEVLRRESLMPCSDGGGRNGEAVGAECGDQLGLDALLSGRLASLCDDLVLVRRCRAEPRAVVVPLCTAAVAPR